jgi:hypothetical protein
MWVNQTALTTALNTAYFAESVAAYVIVTGFAPLLAGLGFLVLTLQALRGARKEPAVAPELVRAAATA